MKTCQRNGREGKMGKINDKMENTTLGWFFLRWFKHDISMVSRNKQIRCFTHKPIRVQFSVDKSAILSGCFHQNLKKNVRMFYTFDWQTLIAGRYFKHCLVLRHLNPVLKMWSQSFLFLRLSELRKSFLVEFGKVLSFLKMTKQIH